MQFKEVIGQEAIKEKLILSAKESRVSHAQLFLGPEGSGKFALALAYAQYLLCPDRDDHDSCGVCASCRQVAKLTHPDLHFVVPNTTNKSVKKDPETSLFINEWRDYVLAKNAYVDLVSWYAAIDLENKQGYINVRDAATLLHNLSIKSYGGEYKIAIIWMPERMNLDAANKMLKLLEEPPEKTVFLIVAEQQDLLLDTIRSRTALVNIPRIAGDALEKALMERKGCDRLTARNVALLSEGNWLKACHYAEEEEDLKYYSQTFQQWMRYCFKASVGELVDFSNNIRNIGRKRQQQLLEHGLQVVRNALLINNNLHDNVLLPDNEKQFNVNFAPFVNPNNTIQFVELLEEGIRQIERNGYAPLIFLDISLKMTKLLRVK